MGDIVSNAAPFTVRHPAPSITNLSPNATLAGGAGFNLTVNGTGFVNGAVITWQGVALPTTFASATQLRGAVTAGQIAQGGAATIGVLNPEPNAGASNIVSFTVTPVRKVYLPLVMK